MREPLLSLSLREYSLIPKSVSNGPESFGSVYRLFAKIDVSGLTCDSVYYPTEATFCPNSASSLHEFQINKIFVNILPDFFTNLDENSEIPIEKKF